MQRKINSPIKSALSNAPYTISEFDISMDLHMSREISNADKDDILMLLAIPSL